MSRPFTELSNTTHKSASYREGAHLLEVTMKRKWTRNLIRTQDSNALQAILEDTSTCRSLDSLTRELMQLKLTKTALCVPCFKTETQVCLLIGMALYFFPPLQSSQSRLFVNASSA
jgi:alkylhydroperoxidase family enzyme